MPRGRAPGYDVQREEILARAAALFAEQGYSATSMNQVAQACKVSKPALYHYVRDKYQLLVEICEGHIERLRALVAAVEAERLPAEPRLRRLIDGFVQEYADAQHAHRVLTDDVKFLASADRARILAGEREVVATFAAAVAEARPDAESARLHTVLTMLLFGMINWMFTWMRPEGRLLPAQMAPLVADLFFSGLAGVEMPPAGRGAAGAAPMAARAATGRERGRRRPSLATSKAPA